MAIPTGPDIGPDRAAFEAGLKKLREEDLAAKKPDVSKSSLDNLDSSYKSARSSTLENHNASEISAKTDKGEAGKAAGVWNKIKTLIAPKNEYEISVSQQEMEDTEAVSQELFKSMSDSSDKNTLSEDKNYSNIQNETKASKAFYTAATGVAKLFQSAKQKFTELKDIFSGLDSTSHIPKEFKAVIPESKVEPKITQSKEEVKEVFDEEHRAVIQEKEKGVALAVAKEVMNEKNSSVRFEDYKKELEELENALPQPALNNEADEVRFNEITGNVLNKIMDFHKEDAEALKNGSIDFGARKAQFIALLNEYKEAMKQF